MQSQQISSLPCPLLSQLSASMPRDAPSTRLVLLAFLWGAAALPWLWASCCGSARFMTASILYFCILSLDVARDTQHGKLELVVWVVFFFIEDNI